MEFYISDGTKFQKLNSISEVELETSEESDFHWNSKPMTFECDCEVLDSDGLNAIRKLIAGGDKGIYNGLTLRDEGYLSPKNAWL